MKQTSSPAEELSRKLFVEVLLPLAETRRMNGAQPYFSVARDSDIQSYFEHLKGGPMSDAEFEFPGGGNADGLAQALVAHWAAEGEVELGATRLRLEAIAAALRKAAMQANSDVDIFCYTLF